jgi:hypothetical protein
LNQNIHFLGGLFSITLCLTAPYSCFCVFETLGGLFYFESLLNQNIHFWGVCFLLLFYLTAPYCCFCVFETLGVFFSLVCEFWKFDNCFFESEFSLFEGSVFYCCLIKLAKLNLSNLLKKVNQSLMVGCLDKSEKCSRRHLFFVFWGIFRGVLGIFWIFWNSQ